MDRYPPKPIFFAALGMFGTIFFLMIGAGAIAAVFIGMSKGGQMTGSAAGIIVACVAVAAVFLWLAYLSLRSVIRRIKEANQAALAGRAAWRAQFEADMERKGSSAGK